MSRSLVAVGALLAGALLVPGEASAQRFGGGVRGGAVGVRSGIGMGAVGIRPGVGLGGVRATAVARPGYGYRPFYRGYYGRGGRYPYYGYYRWGYPYYREALAAGLAVGALGAPYYNYPNVGGYGDSYYGTVGSAYGYGSVDVDPTCWQGPPWCTAAGYPNMGYLRRQQGAPF